MNGEELLENYTYINGYEPEIGECFVIQSNIIETVKCNKQIDCGDCFFRNTVYCSNIICIGNKRKDGNEIYFKLKTNKDMERVPVTVKLWKANINAIIPQYAKNGDAGMDLTAVSVTYDEKLDCFVYDTGIYIAIPEGYVGLVYPRSSNRKTDAYMTNHVGVIDSKIN